MHYFLDKEVSWHCRTTVVAADPTANTPQAAAWHGDPVMAIKCAQSVPQLEQCLHFGINLSNP